MAAKRPATKSRHPSRVEATEGGSSVATNAPPESGGAVEGGSSGQYDYGSFSNLSEQVQSVLTALRNRLDWSWLIRQIPGDSGAPLTGWSSDLVADLVVWYVSGAPIGVSPDRTGLHRLYDHDEIRAAEAICMKIAQAHSKGLPLNRTEAALVAAWETLGPDARAYRSKIQASKEGARKRKGTNTRQHDAYLDVFTAYLDEYHPEDTRRGSEGLRVMFNGEGSELPDMMEERKLRFDDEVRKRMEPGFRRWLSEYRGKKDSKRFVDARKRNEDRKKKPRTVKLMGD